MNILEKFLGIRIGKGSKEQESVKNELDRRLEDDAEIITYNAVGFLPMADGCNTEELIQNLALAIPSDKTICILDLEDYYPKIPKIFGTEYKDTETGLSKVMIDDKVDIRQHFLDTKYKNISILGFSRKLTLEEMAAGDLTFVITRMRVLIEDLKSRFSVILINIPNHPFSEYMYAGIVSADAGFIVVNQQTECADNFYTLSKTTRYVLANIGGLGSFDKAIVNNYIGIGDNYKSIDKLKLELVAIVPFISDVISYASEGRSYIGVAPELNAGYIEHINKIVDIIIEK